MRIFWIAVFVVLVDQATKLAVVQHMHLRQSIPLLGDWLKFTFTENPGMAFGLQVGPDGFVAVLAVLATLLVIWYIWKVRHGYWPYAASLALILGGAIGNIIDRMFYGIVFDYGPLFQGRVVDFIHVDIGYVGLPEAIPILGGAYLSLFPIWNVADMAIVGGVIGVLIFQRRFHRQMAHQMERAKEERIAEEAQQEVPHQASHLGIPTDREPSDQEAAVVEDAPPESQSETLRGAEVDSSGTPSDVADENVAARSSNTSE